MKKIFFVCLLAALFTACGGDCCKDGKGDCCKAEGTEMSQAVPSTTTGGQMFGDEITKDNAITYDAMLEKMGESDSLMVKVTGTVSGVCQKKGCWMNIVSAEEGKPEMMVRFKDYGFFMPMDIAGRTVIVDGYAKKELISVEELRHYAEDAEASAEEIAAITEPEEELTFLAHGVILLDK